MEVGSLDTLINEFTLSTVSANNDMQTLGSLQNFTPENTVITLAEKQNIAPILNDAEAVWVLDANFVQDFEDELNISLALELEIGY